MSTSKSRFQIGAAIVFLLGIGLLAFGTFFLTSEVMAQQEPGLECVGDEEDGECYVPLAPIEGFVPDSGVRVVDGGLGLYLNQLIRMTIAFSAVLAVLFIVIGGFIYVTTAASNKKEDAKDMIFRSIIGLLLAIASVLILQTINPNLLDLRGLRPVSVEVTPPSGDIGDDSDVRYVYSYTYREVCGEDDNGETTCLEMTMQQCIDNFSGCRYGEEVERDSENTFFTLENCEADREAFAEQVENEENLVLVDPSCREVEEDPGTEGVEDDENIIFMLIDSDTREIEDTEVIYSTLEECQSANTDSTNLECLQLECDNCTELVSNNQIRVGDFIPPFPFEDVCYQETCRAYIGLNQVLPYFAADPRVRDAFINSDEPDRYWHISKAWMPKYEIRSAIPESGETRRCLLNGSCIEAQIVDPGGGGDRYTIDDVLYKFFEAAEVIQDFTLVYFVGDDQRRDEVRSFIEDGATQGAGDDTIPEYDVRIDPVLEGKRLDIEYFLMEYTGDLITDAAGLQSPIPEKFIACSDDSSQCVDVSLTNIDNIEVTGGFMEYTGHSCKPETKAIFADGLMKTLPRSKRNLGFDYNLGGTGSPVQAWYSGTVTSITGIGESGGYGRRVTILTDASYDYSGTDYVVYQHYAHLASFADGLSEGDRVVQGDVIGTQGTSGAGGDGTYPSHVDQRTWINIRGEEVDLSVNALESQLQGTQIIPDEIQYDQVDAC